MSQQHTDDFAAGLTMDAATTRDAAPPAAARALVGRVSWSTVAFLALLLGAVALHLYHLGHPFIASWDEDFHAVVAEHLMQHPLEPTLYEAAALHPPGSALWSGYIHIWLHIQPLGMWASALSMRLLGVTTLAMRLPSVFWIAVGMVATYLLGRKLYGVPVGLAGAAFVGYSPYVMQLSQGYVFGDITDTPLLALTPLAILALVHGWRSGRLRWLVLAGVFQGLGYLTKGALSLAPVGVALLLCGADWVFASEAGWVKLRLRGLLPFLAAAAIIALPYNLYVAHAYPATYALENAQWKEALFKSYEHWGRQVDYHLTMYFFALYGGALAVLLVGSAVALAVVGWRRRSRADLLLVAWVVALYLPLSIAVTKSPPMTIAAIPAFGLIAARAVGLALRSRQIHWRALGLGALAGAALAAVLIVVLPITPVDFNPLAILPQQFSPVRLPHRLLPYGLDAGLTLAFAAVFFVLLGGGERWIRERLGGLRVLGGERGARVRKAGAAAVLVVALAVFGWYWVRYDWLVVARPPDDPSPAQAFGMVLRQHTPQNATVLLDVHQQYHMNERIKVMFWANRDVYDLASVQAADVCPLVATAEHNGSPVFVATNQPYEGTALGSAYGWTLYTPNCVAIASK